MLRPPGGLSCGCGLDPLPESSGLAPLQEHLPGVVCHSACGRPVQRRRHGPVCLRHPALRLRAQRWEGEQRRKKRVGEREREREGETWVDVISRMCGLLIEEKEESRCTRVTRKKGGWFTGGLGCTVDVRRVGSHAAWLRSPEIFLTHLSSQSVFIYSLSFWWD